jgi:hypothetical protein
LKSPKARQGKEWEKELVKKTSFSASLEPLLNRAKNKANCFCYSNVKNQFLKDQDSLFGWRNH